MALLCVHYLLVLLNDNQMHGLITATDTEVGSGGGGWGGGKLQGQSRASRLCVCVYGKDDTGLTEGTG